MNRIFHNIVFRCSFRSFQHDVARNCGWKGSETVAYNGEWLRGCCGSAQVELGKKTRMAYVFRTEEIDTNVLTFRNNHLFDAILLRKEKVILDPYYRFAGGRCLWDPDGWIGVYLGGHYEKLIKRKAQVDTTTSYLLVPPSETHALINALAPTSMMDAFCHQANSTVVCDCALRKLVSPLHLWFDEVEVLLGGEALLRPLKESDAQCRLLVAASDIPAGAVMIGASLLLKRNYEVEWDFANKS